jgi:hypothetical protein
VPTSTGSSPVSLTASLNYASQREHEPTAATTSDAFGGRSAGLCRSADEATNDGAIVHSKSATPSIGDATARVD